MPKVTKDTNKSSEDKKVKTTTKSTTKKASTSKAMPVAKKTSSNSTKKKSTITTKKTSKKTSSTKKATTKKVSSTIKKKKLDNSIVAEYYDLPYRYNETIVKILYQTPKILFVYWDISDEDKNKFIKKYGDNFFYSTKPILKIYNLTKNYDFEIEINDFANSWYINVDDANCNYKIELGRKPIDTSMNVDSNYVYISSSNKIEFPNDHILLEELPDVVQFKNAKTQQITTKNISTMRLIGINKIYNVYDFYNTLYKEEILEEFKTQKIINPSSSSFMK